MSDYFALNLVLRGAEYRKDGLCYCLKAAQGGSSKQHLLEVHYGSKTEPLTKGSDNLTNLNEIFEGKPFNYVSLFSGIGGFEQALNKLGGSCVMASEIDKYANQAYEVLYGHPTVGDVTKVAAEDVPDHDLLVGGFPCQAFSVAGKRLGFEEARGTLFFEIARIAKVKRPKAMLLENVKGLVSHDKGKTLDTIIQTLDEIGYTVDFDVMNSKYFGVPQNRERIFIVAVRNDLIEPCEWNVGKRSDVVAKGKRRIKELGVKTFNFDWPAQEEVTVRLRDILESDVDERFYLSEEKTEKLVAQLEAQSPSVTEEIKCYNPRNTYDGTQTRMQDRVYDAEGNTVALTSFCDRLNVIEPQMLGHIELKGHDAIKRVYDPAGVSPTLTTMGGGHREPKIAEGGPKYRIRKLTPRECFRLQGFPDAEFDKLTANGISNSQLYKMAGNAVTINVISALGKRLLPYLND
jgi:DNA (cytosine-5)-methyltransferase 1